jgi:hypothetical protein
MRKMRGHRSVVRKVCVSVGERVGQDEVDLGREGIVKRLEGCRCAEGGGGN